MFQFCENRFSLSSGGTETQGKDVSEGNADQLKRKVHPARRSFPQVTELLPNQLEIL